MGWKILLGFAFFLFAVSSIFVYWFVPSEGIEFAANPEFKGNYNFSVGNGEMQFYKNMRYPSSEISYKISDCPLQKKKDMEDAFEILQSMTILRFYPVPEGEEISVHCEEKIKVEENFFVAGEGGPVNITRTENFNVISHGAILLLRDSDCERPNIAIHELLHALGFDHSENPKNIMHNISRCNQIIGDDIPDSINKVYSVKRNPDLSFENASASLKGRYLDVNLTIRNNGLEDSNAGKLEIYADGEKVKESDIKPLKIGYGYSITFGNIYVPKISVSELRIIINSSFEELDRKNNEIMLSVKQS
ncbi:matrixin family metalloprotease [Candidatus Pacearchaeota archaeon]|nr:matrixin family metalloprotease [Candidatus Pacearchaeota archaeon]